MFGRYRLSYFSFFPLLGRPSCLFLPGSRVWSGSSVDAHVKDHVALHLLWSKEGEDDNSGYIDSCYRRCRIGMNSLPLTPYRHWFLRFSKSSLFFRRLITYCSTPWNRWALNMFIFLIFSTFIYVCILLLNKIRVNLIFRFHLKLIESSSDDYSSSTQVTHAPSAAQTACRWCHSRSPVVSS